MSWPSSTGQSEPFPCVPRERPFEPHEGLVIQPMKGAKPPFQGFPFQTVPTHTSWPEKPTSPHQCTRKDAVNQSKIGYYYPQRIESRLSLPPKLPAPYTAILSLLQISAVAEAGSCNHVHKSKAPQRSSEFRHVGQSGSFLGLTVRIGLRLKGWPIRTILVGKPLNNETQNLLSNPWEVPYGVPSNQLGCYFPVSKSSNLWQGDWKSHVFPKSLRGYYVGRLCDPRHIAESGPHSDAESSSKREKRTQSNSLESVAMYAKRSIAAGKEWDTII